MKKKLSMLLVALLCVGLMAGCGQSTEEDKKEDTTKQEQQADNQDSEKDDTDASAASDEDIVLSGTYYSGQVQVTVTLHPDGTADMVANGEDYEGTWEEGKGDVVMVVHFEGDMTCDLDVTEEDGAYTAMFTPVAGMTITGKAN